MRAGLVTPSGDDKTWMSLETPRGGPCESDAVLTTNEASLEQCGSFVCHHGFFKQFIIRAEFDAELVKRRGITAETLEELFQLPHRFAKIVQAAPNDKDIDVADRRSVPE